MKKHEIKSGRTKPPEVRTREQIENETFNRMLLWVAVAAVVEVVMVLINRFYINTRVSELNAKIVLYYVLTALPFVGGGPVRDPSWWWPCGCVEAIQGRTEPFRWRWPSDFCAWACAAF